MGVISAWIIAASLFVASIAPGLKGYEGQPGNQGGGNHHGGGGLSGYEGQPGNQGGH